MTRVKPFHLPSADPSTLLTISPCFESESNDAMNPMKLNVSAFAAVTFLMIAAQVVSAQSKSSILFPKVRCALAFRRLDFSVSSFDKYPIYFRNDSAVQLAQAGIYQGPKDMEEYIKFVVPGYSPYLKKANFTQSRKYIRENTLQRALGYKDGKCEFLLIYKRPMDVNATNTNAVAKFNYLTMLKLFYDFESNYITKINVFFAADFLSAFFNKALNSDKTRRFVCKDVIEGPCASMLNQTTDLTNETQCEATLNSLPIADGSLIHIDGYSQGCRFLHAAFALVNPTMHCPHLSFAPMADFLGRFKCQHSKEVLPTELFVQSDFDTFRSFATSHDIDPDKGHDMAM
jgi:hypothetical protein